MEQLIEWSIARKQASVVSRAKKEKVVLRCRVAILIFLDLRSVFCFFLKSGR